MLSIQVDCTFDANFFGKNVTFVASKLAAIGQFIFCLLFNVYDLVIISENKGRLGELIMDIFLGHNEDNFLKFLTRAFVNICC